MEPENIITSNISKFDDYGASASVKINFRNIKNSFIFIFLIKKKVI